MFSLEADPPEKLGTLLYIQNDGNLYAEFSHKMQPILAICSQHFWPIHFLAGFYHAN